MDRTRSILIALLVGGLSPFAAYAQITFNEVADDVGLGDDYYEEKSKHGLGMNWLDFNRDTWPDLFLVNGTNRQAHLYMNRGDGTFTNMDDLLPPLPNHDLMASVYADTDNDGDSDIYIFVDNGKKSTSGSGGNPPDGPPNVYLKCLWTENGGQFFPGVPLYTNVTAQAELLDMPDTPFGNLTGFRNPTGNWVDYDRDGYVDLLIGHWVCERVGHAGSADRLYRNNGDGTFSNVTSVLDLHQDSVTNNRRPTLAAIAAHMDNDLWPDIYLANVQLPDPHHHDFYLRNAGDGTFSNAVSSSPGVGDDSGAAMGITIGDIDLDGDWDFYMSDLWDPRNETNGPLSTGNPLYLGNGDGSFSDNSALAAGVRSDNSWGVNFFDADNNCYEDLFVATTKSRKHDFFRNNSNGTFTEISSAAGFTQSTDGRGSSTCDYDKDGDLDLIVVNQQGGVQFYRNDTTNKGHWLQIRLKATVSNRDAIGTLAKVHIGDKTLMRQVIAGDSAHGQDSGVLHFGLGETTVVDRVDVFWPSGEVQSLFNVAADQFICVTEGLFTLSDIEKLIAGDHIELTWNAMSGRVYEVRYRADATDPGWTKLCTYTTSVSSAISCVHTTTSPCYFYSVLEMRE